MTGKDSNRYEIPLLLTFLVVGVAGFLVPQQTSSATLLTQPHALLLVWYAVSAVAGGIGLAGIAASRLPRKWLLGQVLLRFGLCLVAVQLTAFGVAALGLFNLRALFTATVLLGFAWSCWSRVVSISRDVGKFRHAVSQMEGVDELGHHPPGSGGPGRSGGPGPAVADPEGEGRDEENLG